MPTSMCCVHVVLSHVALVGHPKFAKIRNCYSSFTLNCAV